MNIKEQNYRNYIFGLILVSFLILTGFEFMGMQEKLQNAEDLLNKKEYTKAEEILNSVINNLKVIDESSSEMEKTAKSLLTPQVYFMLGEIQYQQVKYESATVDFEKVVSYPFESQWNIKAYLYLGRINLGMKKYSIARGNFYQLVDKYSSSQEAPEAQYYIGVSYEMEGNIEQAVTSYKKFLTLFPGHEWAGEIRKKIEAIQVMK